MRWKQLLAVAVLGGSSAAAAIAAPASSAAQATRPAGAGAPRAQQPAEDRRPRVLVLPFVELSDEPKREWVGKAMQQSLVAELTRSGLVSVMTPAADVVPAADADAAAAAKLARDVHAPLAIMGSYQLVGEELRVTGQMIEAIDGEHIAAIKATGSLRDLFNIEDMIGHQVRRDLQVILQPPAPAPADPNMPIAGANDPFGVQPTGPVSQQPPAGSYDGSDLQRSLESDRWSPPAAPSYVEDRRNRVRYDPGYYPPYYYPPYSYYDWCGYNYPIIIRPGSGTVVPPGPGPTRTDFPQNNYNTTPGQMGRPAGNTNFNNHPGQMGRANGNVNFNTTPGQMGRSGGNTNFNNPPGQSGRSSGGNQVGGSSGRSSGGSAGSSRSSGSRSVPGSSGNASGNLGSTSGNASKR